MEALLAAVASSLFTVLGTGLLQSRREARRGKMAQELQLRNALSEFGAALDALIVELQQLPAPQRRALTLWTWVERKLPGLDYLVGRLARVLFGRQLYAVLDRIQRATNDLMLLAPPEAVEALTPIFCRLSSFPERGDNWFELLQEERSAFAAVSRSLFLPETSLESGVD